MLRFSAETINSELNEEARQLAQRFCLICHGTDLTEPVRAILTDFYPDDWATGYALGQVRGAISLARQLSIPGEHSPESLDEK